MFKKLDTGSIAAGLLLAVGPPPDKPEGPTFADLNSERDGVRKQIEGLKERKDALEERMDEVQSVWSDYNRALTKWEASVGEFATKCIEGERK